VHILISKKQRVVAPLPSLCLSPSNWWVITFGMTTFYLGFGIILKLCLRVRGILPRSIGKCCSAAGTALAYVGVYSYSIYLWHLPIREWGLTLIEKVPHPAISPWVSFILYAFASTLVGIFLSRTLEYPVLRLRDRWFPTMQSEQRSAPRLHEELLVEPSMPGAPLDFLQGADASKR